MLDIIITGASGFVGQNLIEYFNKNKLQVIPLSLRSSFKIDYTADALIHLAGKAHDTKKTSSEKEYFEINTELTKKVFQEFLNSGIKDFIYFSSVKATADSIGGLLDENHKSNPQTPYGKSKLEAEKYLLEQNLPKGKRLFIIRPCMIHGQGNKGNLNLLYKFVKNGIPYPLVAFDNKRSFLSIDNLNFLIFEMLKNDKLESGIYNFADDESLATTELVTLIGQVTNKKTILWKIPKRIIHIFIKIGDFLHLPLNTERFNKLTETYLVDNAKIKKALRIEKLPITAQEGLEKTIKSFN